MWPLYADVFYPHPSGGILYIYNYIYIFIYSYTYMHIHTYIYTYIIYIYIYIYICIYIFIFIYDYIIYNYIPCAGAGAFKLAQNNFSPFSRFPGYGTRLNYFFKEEHRYILCHWAVPPIWELQMNIPTLRSLNIATEDDPCIIPLRDDVPMTNQWNFNGNTLFSMGLIPAIANSRFSMQFFSTPHKTVNRWSIVHRPKWVLTLIDYIYIYI